MCRARDRRRDELLAYGAPPGCELLDLRLHGFPYLLQNARHGPHDLGPVQLQQLFQIVRVAVGNGYALMEVAIAEHPLQHVRQRQHGKSLAGSLREHPPQAAAQIEGQVPVREHHAFGSARGAGSVDDGSQAPGIDSQRFGAYALHGRAIEGGRLAHDAGQGSAGAGRLFHAHDRLQLRQVPAQRLENLPLPRAGNQDHPAAAVPQQIADLRRRLRVVNRHHHQPRQQDGEIGDMPLRPILGEHRHPIARRQTAGKQKLPQRENGPRETLRGPDHGLARLTKVLKAQQAV